MQIDIFNYELSAILTNFSVLQPNGFAAKVFLKEIIHKLHSYELAYDSTITSRLKQLAKLYNLQFDTKQNTTVYVEWKKARKLIQKWSNIRNNATGHYHPNVSLQVDAIEKVDVFEVLDCVVAFISYNDDLTKRFGKSFYERKN